MAKAPGSIWIEVNELHFVDASGNERYFQGDYYGPLGGSEPKQRPGSLWIGSDAYLYYIGGNGLKYRIPLVVIHADSAGPIGVSPGNPNTYNAFLWVEGVGLYHGVNTGKFLNHSDHSDGGSTHTDQPHGDGHTDSSHGDSHGDGHTDSSHGDSHTDAAHGDGVVNHSDGHYDHTVTGPAGPGNHSDGGVYWNRPDGHVDNNYNAYNSYGYGAGPQHTDTHYDSGDHTDGSHGDSHSDGAHGDGHNDQAHVDGTHGDGHLDTGHQDSAGGGGHVDYPAYIGP